MLNRWPALRAPVLPGASVSITFKGLGAYDYPSAFAWPPPQPGDTAGSGGPREGTGGTVPSPGAPPTPSLSFDRQQDEYATHYRSPFSVLRSRQSRVNRCAAGMLGAAFDTSAPFTRVLHEGGGGGRGAGCASLHCCCSALMYPSAAPAPTAVAAQSEAAERVRDDFLMALKLGAVDDLLQQTIGADLHARLMAELGASPSSSAAVLACSDPLTMREAMGSESTHATSFVVRLLLSAEEDNRIRWLQEESAAMEPADYYSRAPSLRALFVMWSLLQHQQRVRSTAVLGSGSGGGGRHSGASVDAEEGRGGWGRPPRHAEDGPRVRSPASARSPSSLVPSPRMAEIRHVLLRMEESRMEVTMSDLAALAAIGAGSTGAAAVPDGEFWDSLAKQLRPQEMAAALRSHAARQQASSSSSSGFAADDALELRHVLLLCLFLRYVLLVRGERARLDAATSLPLSPSALASRSKMLLPITAFEAASDVIQLRKVLTEPPPPQPGGAGGGAAPSSALREALVVLSDVVLRHAFEMAEEAHIPSSSPQLPELTTWLLREMVASPVCAFHFKRLVDRSITEALVALEKSGLVSRSAIDLRLVVRQLLPLLESCGSEDLYTAVLRDVLAALEEKARRDGYAFSAEDLSYLAELGTKLFATGPSDSTAGGYGLFDETARGQMEELHVMDGSPWALCVSSYRSLKEMVQGIVRDQRRVKEQVQEQLRQLSNASSSLSAVMTGSGGEAGGGDGSANRSAAAAAADGGSAAASSESSQPAGSTQSAEAAGGAAAGTAPVTPVAPPRIPVSPMLRQRFLILVEELVKAQVDESSRQAERPIVVSSALFSFVTQHVPVPNIQDEYRRKIFLLVNVAEDAETTRERLARRREERRRRLKAEGAAGAAADGGGRRRRRARKTATGGDAVAAAEGGAKGTGAAAVDGGEAAEAAAEADVDLHGGANDIPAELRFLVSSLPLTLSPWASVMILREVLAESAGRNPRYTYVLNAAIDLQLPISTTRSRIATTLNMWRFLNTQSHKLSLKESLVMKQRCAWNLPLSYILSSYWSLLTWLTLASILTLNVVGIDWESQIVANSLFRMFAPWEEICAPQAEEEAGAAESWTTQAAADLAADYFEQAEIADRRREEHQRSSTNVFLSSASYLILGYDDQRRPMTVIPIGSDRTAAAEERAAEEYAAATAVLRELSLHAPFPFFVDIERAMPTELVEMRIAERIRRVSFNNTWFLPRMIIRTFPLGRQYTEHKLILHTCTQANLTRRRVTFLLYMHDGVAVTPQFIQQLNASYLSRHANLVLVVHESSLLKGGTTPAALDRISKSGTGQATLDTSASVAAAAAEVVDAVLPEELKGDVGDAAAAGDAATPAPSDRQVRVLPFCRQFYTGDGTVAADAVRGRSTQLSSSLSSSTSTSPAASTGGEERWWRRLQARVTGADKQRQQEAAEAERRRAAMPTFALSFHEQRAFLHRSRAKQQAEEEAARVQRAQEQEQLRRHGHFFAHLDAASIAGRCAQLWRSTLTGVSAMAAPVLRATPDGGWEEDVSVQEARQSAGTATQRGTDVTASAAAPPASNSSASAGHPGESHDEAAAVAERAGKDVVSVSFPALRRLMSEVSAPVPIPRKKPGAATAASPVAASESDGGCGGRQAGEQRSRAVDGDGLKAASPAAPSDGLWGQAKAFFGGQTASEHAAGRERAEAVPVSAPPPPPATPPMHTAALWQPYTFTYGSNATSTSESPLFNGGGGGGGTPSAGTPPVSPTSPSSASSLAKSTTTPGAAAGGGVVFASQSPAPALSLSFASLPLMDASRYTSYKWESEWQKTDELLAQLQQANRKRA